MALISARVALISTRVALNSARVALNSTRVALVSARVVLVSARVALISTRVVLNSDRVALNSACVALVSAPRQPKTQSPQAAIDRGQYTLLPKAVRRNRFGTKRVLHTGQELKPPLIICDFCSGR